MNTKTNSGLGEQVGIARHTLRLFLECVDNHRALWLLGAGASFALRPLAPQLMASLAYRSWNLPGYPVRPAQITGFRHLILNQHTDDTGSPRFWKSLHASEGVMGMLYEGELLGASPDDKAAQYALFGLVSSGSKIMTTNQDALLHDWAPQQNILCLHGCVYELLEAPYFSKAIRESLRDLLALRLENGHVFDVDPLHSNHLLFPGDQLREPFLARAALAGRWLATSSALAIVGYSLCDDHVVEMVARGLRDNPKLPVFIIDPNARELARMLSDLGKTNQVFPIPVDWKSFSEAVCEIACRSQLIRLKDIAGLEEDVLLLLQPASS